jgi:antitoxin component HigA of HigAB toxin-antitoxin module
MTAETLERKLKPLSVPVENPLLQWLYLHFPPQSMKNKKMYQTYRQAIQILMHSELSPIDSDAVAQYLRCVLPLVVQYEKSEFPMRHATPEEMLEFLLDQNGLRSDDLAKELGGRFYPSAHSVKAIAGRLATLDEMSFPDWRERLARVRREQSAGKSISLDAYIARRRRRIARKSNASRA